jgi:hypothetical protein
MGCFSAPGVCFWNRAFLSGWKEKVSIPWFGWSHGTGRPGQLQPAKDGTCQQRPSL